MAPGNIDQGSIASIAVTDARAAPRLAPDEALLLARLRAGDERAFDELVRSFYPAMLAVARAYARTRAVADEIVQDAWVGVLVLVVRCGRGGAGGRSGALPQPRRAVSRALAVCADRLAEASRGACCLAGD